MSIRNAVTWFFSSPRAVCAFILGISFTALAVAFISEGFLGLEPCKLCIYQRYPYALAMVLGIAGLLLYRRTAIVRSIIGLSSLTFFCNSVIAFFHTGVERHWWDPLEGCKIFNFDHKKQSILENIMSTPLGSCDEIPWADPIFGLSMANYNVILCILLGVICLIAAFYIKTRQGRAGES